MAKYSMQFALHNKSNENELNHLNTYITEQLNKLKEIYNNKVNIYDSSTIIFDYTTLDATTDAKLDANSLNGGYVIDTNINTTFVQSLFEKLHKEVSKTALEHNIGYAFNVHLT